MPSAAAALDRLFFVVRVLNERHESHSLANWKKRIQEKHAVGLLLQKTLKRRKQDAKATAPQKLHKRSTKNSKILAVYKATTYKVSLHLWEWILDARLARGPLDR